MNARARKGMGRIDRLAALVLSFAGLAECAATRSAPVRFVVLFILRLAEAFIAGFVADTDPDAADWHAQHTMDFSGNSPADALALALSFRLLAIIVQAVAVEAARLPDAADVSGVMGRVGGMVSGMKLAAPLSAKPRDTS